MSNLYVAKTIIDQINSADPTALMAWGTHNPVGSDKETTLVEYNRNNPVKTIYKDFGCRGWVQFDVNGLKFKGRVYVGLNAMDLYDVLLIKNTLHKDYSMSSEKVGEANDIYCDDLMTTIDRMIERD